MAGEYSPCPGTGLAFPNLILTLALRTELPFLPPFIQMSSERLRNFPSKWGARTEIWGVRTVSRT